MVHPKACSNPRMISSGMDAPPEMQVRRDEVSAVAAERWCSIAAYIVGTPAKMVTVSRPKMSRALPASNLGSSVRQLPAAVTRPAASCSCE
jgi:hypothetical protein